MERIRAPLPPSRDAGGKPLRSELLSGEQLQRHARSLAERHQLDFRRGRDRMLPRLAANEGVLIEAHEVLMAAEAEGESVAGASEWLLDNYHLIEQQIYIARLHLPRTYSRQLPRVAAGPTAGVPRVYDIALELIEHVDGRVDAENLSRFVAAYQSAAPLSLGELWAIPIMLRLALIENLRLVAADVARRRKERNLARHWAGRLLAAGSQGTTAVLQVLAALALSDPAFTNPFVEELGRRLLGQNPALAIVQNWVEQRLAEQSLSREQLQQADSQSQAADTVSFGNSIGSLRFLSEMNWPEFVETLSVVERVLRGDPAGVYGEADFATRDRCRHSVEALARKTGRSELDVAQTALRLAQETARGEGAQARAAHVGFHLIGEGRSGLEGTLHSGGPSRRLQSRLRPGAVLVLYLGPALFMTVAAALLAAPPRIPPEDWQWWLLAILAFVGASQAALSVVNRLVTAFVPPRMLPRLDFAKGIPSDHRTLVVIPAILSDPREVANLLEGLEIRFLGNRDPNLWFALLTDFPDAPTETLPEDAALLRLAKEGIEALNEKYGSEGRGVFYLFHRPRLWNPHERLWMGYERKRGKLEQLNALLRDGPQEAFSDIVGDPAPLRSIKYVITLDSDTTLPREAARKLVGTLAHPLNRPRFDPRLGRVVEGYAILQPRVPTSLRAANSSRYVRLSEGEAGLDPYTHEVSDVYQDLFAEGSYVGKGIYDVDAFRLATAERFPENLILSHDLLESCYARSALITDVELYEDRPARLPAEMSRRHRWIRGDWQIARWLLPRPPGLGGGRRPARLSAVAWWKILDNLRRSLVPPALWLLLLVGWTLAPDAMGRWTQTVVAVLAGPALVTALADLVGKPRERSWRMHARTTAESVLRNLALAALDLAFLPYRAAVYLQAILATGVRMLFTRRGLLIWHLPAYARRNAATRLRDYLREMWVAPLSAAAGLGWLAAAFPGALPWAGPVLLLWLLAPLAAWWIGGSPVPSAPVLLEAQRVFLRSLARRTWCFFERFVDEGEHWIPPDNYQEVPKPTVASRTSPTNMGMALLANLAAYDFGYLSLGQLLDRTEKAMTVMEGLERYRGHFLNWYDTKTLRPLAPLYVSSVDSGNLLAALLVLRAGLLELAHLPVEPGRVIQGLNDTLLELEKQAHGADGVLPALRRARAILHPPPEAGPDALVTRLEQLAREASAVSQAVSPLGVQELAWWAGALERQSLAALDDLKTLAPEPREAGQPETLEELAAKGACEVADRIRRIESLALRCLNLAAMDFSFLYDSSCDLLSVGFGVSDRRLDPSHYDRLASEARLASYVLIAADQLPQEHWFAMDRQLTTRRGARALLSWGGTMFEYLMPLLVMPTYPNTLLDETYRAVVGRQIQYGRERGVPWGVSESCYNATDAGGAYQYRAFGVPGLGLRRGLADDLVVAPYAAALALMVTPAEACRNLQRLVSEGYQGAFGLYEAIDFTPSRVPRGASAIVRGYMAHHQGMSLLALAYLLLGRPMQRRFLSDPSLRAAELLLQERVPNVTESLRPHPAEVTAARRVPRLAQTTMRVFAFPDTPIPEAHLLSNGRYHVMATNAGGGYSRWNDLAVTRWQEDPTCDAWGQFCYLRDRQSGALWSAAYQPTRQHSRRLEAIFVQGRAEYRRRDHDIDSHTEIAVSPEDDVEVRRVTLTNLSARARSLELTSYAEVVIAPPNADFAHRAFNNLFVQTEILTDRVAILATRRPRSAGERPAWMFHLLTAQGRRADEASFETDRAKFLGRGRTVARPAAFDRLGPLSGSAGAVLDPVVAIRQSIIIEPDTSANVHLITGMAETREAAIGLIDRYRDPSFAARAFEMAWSHSQVVLFNLDASEEEAQVYGELASFVLHANAHHRAPSGILSRNRRGQSGLWSFGISGDLPIVLARIADVGRVDLVEQLLKAHAYWRVKGLEVDLVILNEDFSGYRQVLNDRILNAIAASPDAPRVDKPGGVFVRRSDQLSEEDRVLLQTVARAILSDEAGTFEDQVHRTVPRERKLPRFAPTRPPTNEATAAPPPPERILWNGLGGFTPDGREYIITLSEGDTTPAPWANVLANPQIGTVVSESGSAYTWVANSHEFRLTPWHNDPVTDASSEAIYVRDEQTGQFWSPAPLPARGPGDYVCRHGFGYSVFEHTQCGVSTETWTYVALEEAVKFVVVRLRNRTARARRLSVAGFWELVLGQWRHTNQMHVVTEPDPSSGSIFARNSYNQQFASYTVFAHASGSARSITGSRAEFVGRNGSLADPAAMHQQRLSGKTGAGLDPCAAILVPVDLPEGEEREVVFVLGAGRNPEEARILSRRFGGSAGARQALERVWDFWKRSLGVVYAETPDASMNVLVNGWLEYQALACRYWGRSGYYQSGGAYGFRDQLQDTAALLHAAPWTAREHLLRSAGRQFRDGDVQHWWHPPSGRGVRTHFSDDYLWLAYAAHRYVTATGDTGVLDERAPFLDGRPLNPEEESYYDLPQRAEETGTLYEHCVRAIQHGLRFGAHGLPLIGCGDWNDGMNLVGRGGQGESVWLAFFLYDVLQRFGELARRRADEPFARRCLEEAARLQHNIEEHAWDGLWYRRAFFDDGTPLGSSTNEECQIDSLPQSWAVLSGAADPARARQAMESVAQRLVRRDRGLIQIFDPPFDSSRIQPGYIRGYPPGVRENGGQYTHAALWAIMAFAELGEADRAWELLSMINPVNHSATAEAIRVYRVEPYVMAADVYAVPPLTGRGGWTWYTGSAGWMYRLIVETLLGLHLEVDHLRLSPRLPRDWRTFKIHYRYRDTFYHLTLTQVDAQEGAPRVTVDGVEQPDPRVPLSDDRQDHAVEVLVPARRPG